MQAAEFSLALFRGRLDAGVAIVVILAAHDVAAIDVLADELAVDERTRAGRFKFVEDRCAYVAAHVAMTRLVDAVLGARAWRIVDGANGKPEVEAPGHAALHVNLSHTRGLIAVGLSRVAPLGVDVEGHRAMPDRAALLDRVLSPAEAAAVARSPFPDVAFLTCWCRKEAWLKALGLGITTELNAYCVADCGAPTGPGPVGGLTLVDLPVADPFSGALCVLAEAQPVMTLTCTPAQLPR